MLRRSFMTNVCHKQNYSIIYLYIPWSTWNKNINNYITYKIYTRQRKIFIIFYLWIYLYSNRCAMVIHLVFHKQHGQIHLNVHLLFRISWKNYMCPPMLTYKAQICLCRHFTQRVARYRHNNQASGKEISRVKNWWPDLWGKVIKKNVGYRIFSINTKLLLRGKGRDSFK